MKTPAYQDIDLIPFGKYKGKPLSDVPVSYLHWYYHLPDANDLKLLNYIENSIDTLKQEEPDLIWKLKKQVN